MLLGGLCLFIGQIDLVVQEVLGVRKVLHCPGLLLSLLILGNVLIIFDLLSAGRIYLINVIRFESLEVVGYVAMLSELGGGGHWVLSHEIGHVSSCDFFLIHVLLVVGPGLLSIFLLLCEHLIVRLHILKLLILLVRHLVFEESTHSCDCLSLHGVHGLFVLQRLFNSFFFRFLLLYPILLVRVVQILSVSVVCRNRKKYVRIQLLEQ